MDRILHPTDRPRSVAGAADRRRAPPSTVPQPCPACAATRRSARRPLLLPLTLLVLAPASRAADDTLEELARKLGEALAKIDRLEGRVAELEGERQRARDEDDLEAQLQRLIAPEPPAAPRTTFPSAMNPRIGVFMDAVIDAGNTTERLGEDGDRFSLRETEIDFRLPIAPFAEGVLISVFEDVGDGEFESTIEEGYIDVGLGGLLDSDIATRTKAGRFRVPFGHDNKLHTHDLLQVDRPLAVTHLLGPEGLIGDGLELTQPLHHSGEQAGTGRTTTLQMALVNGDMLSREESPLGESAADAGLGLSSDSPLAVARVSHFVELDPLSDVELGASVLRNVGSRAVRTDAGTEIDTTTYGADATLRLRDDETGVGSWLFSGEVVATAYDYGAPVSPDFPSGSEHAAGFWVTAQRQTSASTYVGLRVGKTDAVGSADSYRDVTPYVSWYADEFFRVRLQGQQIERYGPDDTSAQRLLLELTWNFGAHQPHPYWVNR